MAGNDYSDLIEKALRLLTPTAVEQSLQITANYTAGSGTMTVDAANPAYAAAGRPGTILGSGAGGAPQAWTVQKDNGSGVLSVIGGAQGSTDTNVTGSATSPAATVWVRPKFTRWDIAEAINDELLALSSPDNGLGQILVAQITYIPVFMGYALPATFVSDTSKVLEVMFTEPLPWKRNPIMRDSYRVDRSGYFGQNPTVSGLIIHQVGYPGLPLFVQYLSPFSTLTNLTDNVLTVAGVPIEAQDIVAWGAALRLAPDREIQRNSMSSQPDPRKATEIPAGAIGRSADTLANRYAMRISQERNRIMRAYPHGEGW